MRKIRTLYNGRKALLGLVKANLSKRRIPVRISLLVTKRCNLRCFYCYATDTLNSRQVKEPSLTELKEIVDQIYNAGCRWICILGGEPLIRDDIEEFVDYAHRKGMFLDITTNGYFVKDRINTLKKVDHVAISLDGNKVANDKSRGKNSFERIIEGIELAVKNKIDVRIHSTLCKRTMCVDSLRFLADFCNKHKIKFNFSENGLPGIEKLDPDFLLSEEETLVFYKSYKGLKKIGYPIVSSDMAVDYVSKWPVPGRTTIYKSDLNRISGADYYPCKLGRIQCFINVDGFVYPCTKKWGEGKNLFEVGFQEAWDYLANLDCVACKELGTIEQSLITGLNVKALFNAITKFAL